MTTVVAGDEGFDYVNGAGWISDDSSYYGDDDSPVKYKTSEPLSNYWEIHSRLPDVAAQANRPKNLVIRPRVVVEPKPEQAPTQPLCNTVLDTTDRRKRKASPDDEQGVTTTIDSDTDSDVDREVNKQRSETVDAYLLRLPPSRSDFETHGPWLWIHNPDRKSRSTKTFNKGEFMNKAYKLLDVFKSLENKTREAMPGKAAVTITKKLTPKRKELEHDIREVAKETGCLSGKWMLFSPIEDIDRVWRAVCKGVESGKLGPTAKVATNGGELRNEREAYIRLICVYTKDFSDERDVRRVLDALLELTLVKLPEDDMSNGIYYKCDAYTYLNLNSGNDYKIKPSIYSSKAMLKGVKWK